MTTPEIIEYVKHEISLGTARNIITLKLKSQGWSDLDIVEVFSVIDHSSVAPSVPPQTAFKAESFQPIQYTNTANILGSVEPTRSKKSLKLFLIILIPLFLIIGGMVAYASGFIIPFKSVFAQSLITAKDSTGSTFDIQLIADGSGMKSLHGEGGTILGASDSFIFDTKGSYDISDAKNIKSDIILSLKSGKLEAGINFRAIDESLYLNLIKGPDLGFFSLKPFENKWMVIPYKSKSGDFVTDPVLANVGVDSSVLNKITEEQKQRIYDITEKASFIKITGRHAPALIDGVLTFHFDFDLDREGIIAYAKELTEYAKSIDTNNTDFSGFSSDENIKFLEIFKSFHGEAWIGIIDHLPHKIIATTEFVNPKNLDDGVVKVSLITSYRDWNKPIIVEKPQDAKTFKEFMSSATSESISPIESNADNNVSQIEDSILFANANKKGEEAAIKSIESSLRAQAELFYDYNNLTYKGFCSSKGQDGAYQRAKELPPNTNYKCNDTAKTWNSWAMLNVGEYYCVDNTGFSGTIPAIPKGTSCK